ncbi:DUF2306 domain-containing protein [Pseudoalteromonas sp. MMG005]|uniref:DUF2306 domain-containing protein n=1 Tax=Pseudoalteromonas sp. MMG005 TaxID=2822682 RepID=UPI001B3A48C4|nr:DUF2306 domain-containing protein [Pseudoalteromonas sp. MMG005]MBQ4848305.1 DUF2306 domain-containing protein [Pseudoalteromonas sp. MMG005]
MDMSPMMLIHIITGSIAVLSGVAALALKKGKKPHRNAGKIFVVSMTLMALTGGYIAYIKPMMITLIAGLFTLHLVLSAFLIVKSPPHAIKPLDYMLPFASAGLCVASAYFGYNALTSPIGHVDGFSHEPYFFFALLSLVALIGDIKLVINKGISNTQRMTRHIWRMSFALYIAIGSFFGQGAQALPDMITQTFLMHIPESLILLIMCFWLGKTWLNSRKSRPVFNQ